MGRASYRLENADIEIHSSYKTPRDPGLKM